MQNSPPIPMLSLINNYLSSPLQILRPLQADRPASSYQQSYTKYHQSKLSSKLSDAQTSQLLNTIQELKHELNKKQNSHKQQITKYHQQILLMSIQNQRVRTIMKQQGQSLQKMKHQWNSLESIYILKFQQLKLQLNKSYQQQLFQTKKQISQTIQEIRSLYVSKIGILTREYEEKLKQKEKEIYSMKQSESRIQLYQLKIQELEDKTKMLLGRNQRLEEEILRLKQQKEINLEEYKIIKQQKQSGNSLYKQRNQQLININRQLNQQITRIKQDIIKTRDMQQKDLNIIVNEKKNKQEQIQKLKYKCYKLQQELEQFKNRKTQQQLIGGQNFFNQGLATGKKIGLHNAMRNESANKPVSFNNKPSHHSSHDASILIEPHYHMNHQHNHQQHNSLGQIGENQSHIRNQINQNSDIRRQTEQRISYQQSLKKLHEMQTKFQHMNEQISRLENSLQQKTYQLEESNKQLFTIKRSLSEKQALIKSLLKSQKQKDSNHKQNYKGIELAQKDSIISNLRQQIQQKAILIAKLQKQNQKLTKKQKQSSLKHQQTTESLNAKIKTKDNQINEKIKEIRQKDQQITKRNMQIENLLQRNHNLELKIAQNANNNSEGINDPFAQPLINLPQSIQKKNGIKQLRKAVSLQQKSGQNQQQMLQMAKRLHKYQDRITQLQQIIEGLKFQWGQTQQNQNAIFRQIQSNYTDQIKLLKIKNQQNQQLIIQTNKLVEIMAKKGSPQQEAQVSSKGKGKK